jgi:hypothetical protein
MPPSPGRKDLSSLDVVVVAFHSGDLLEQCLTAVADFVPAGSRFFVVDNSPDDESAAKAVAGLPAAELVSEPRNVGFAAAANDGIARGGGDVVMIVNPDIASITGSYDAVRSLFARRPDAGAVAVHITKASGALEHCRRFPRLADFVAGAVGTFGERIQLARGRPPPMLEWNHEDVREVDTATGALLFLRRTALEHVGPFDDRFFMYFEEIDWLYRARRRGWRLIFTPEVRCLHGGRASSPGVEADHSLLLLESSYTFVRKRFGALAEALLRLTWIVADGARLAVSLGRTADYRGRVRGRLLLHLGLHTHQSGREAGP